MQSFDAKISPRATTVQPTLLLATAIIAALLTGAIAAIFGGIAALLTLFVILFMALAVSDYRAGVLIAIVLLPLSGTYLIPRELFGIVGFNPLNATLLMSMMSLLFMLLFHRGAFTMPACPRLFWIYLLVWALAALHGAFQVSSMAPFYKALHLVNFDTPGGYLLDVFLKHLLIPLTAFMFAVAIKNARDPKKYMVPFFLSAIVLPIAAVGYIAASGASLSMLASSQSRDFLSVIGMHANELGLMFNMAFALALFSFSGMPKGFWKWVMGAAIVVLTTAVALTFSRGAYLGFLAVTVYFLYTQRRFSIMLAGMALLPLAILLMPQAVVERATVGTQSGNIDTISAGRVDQIWRPLLPEVLTSPVIGHGLSSILWSESARTGLILPVAHPHNAYLGVLLDFGLLGALAIFLFFRHMWRLFRELAQVSGEPIWRGFFKGATAGILLLLVQGISDDRFTPTFSQTFLWLSYGIAMGMAARLHEPNLQTPQSISK